MVILSFYHPIKYLCDVRMHADLKDKGERFVMWP